MDKNKKTFQVPTLLAFAAIVAIIVIVGVRAVSYTHLLNIFFAFPTYCKAECNVFGDGHMREKRILLKNLRVRIKTQKKIRPYWQNVLVYNTKTDSENQLFFHKIYIKKRLTFHMDSVVTAA